MKTEQIEEKSNRQSSVYGTLEEALQAKLKRTQKVMSKLKPEARDRLLKQSK